MEQEVYYTEPLLRILRGLKYDLEKNGEGFPVSAYMSDDGPFSYWIGSDFSLVKDTPYTQFPMGPIQ